MDFMDASYYLRHATSTNMAPFLGSLFLLTSDMNFTPLLSDEEKLCLLLVTLIQGLAAVFAFLWVFGSCTKSKYKLRSAIGAFIAKISTGI